MKYKVLYRKYRPTDFENIIGQDYIIKTLKNSIINNNISHAYIFSGPRGTGKTTTAKVFSKAINCLNPISGSPCGECEFCQNFHDNPDIIEIDAASNNGVDEIRGLIENVKLTPTNGKYKVYIIDEVHMLSTSAFNALLLTLEEPPAHSIFILATTNIENVPITILSRCQRFDFQKITVEDICKRLKEISEIENIKITPDAIKEIAYLSEGGLRDALGLLDQLSKNDQEITLELIENQIKTISLKGVKELISTIEDNDTASCLNLINEYRKRAVDYKSLVKKIIDVASENAKNIKCTGRYKRLDFSDYKKLIFDLSESLTKININVEPYTILELIFLDYFSDTSKSPKMEEETKEIKKIKEEAKEDTKQNDIEKLIDIRINNCFVNAKKEFLELAKKEISDFTLMPTINGKIKSILTDSTVVAASDTNLILTCTNKHNIEAANDMLFEIEKSISKEENKLLKIIFITEDKWQKERAMYIENLKNKKVYELIPEEEEKIEDKTEINDVFDNIKVEII